MTPHELPIVVLLYYKYTTIENPQEFCKNHLNFCKELGLLGRIIIAGEGINGTVAGDKAQTDAYMAHLSSLSEMDGIEFKIEYYHEQPFPKMSCKVKNEIVQLRAKDEIDPHEITGDYLEPHEFMEKMNDPNVIILDTRNNYESKIGKFKNALTPDIVNFRDFPEYISQLEAYKDKTILAYCTGGIRCEKATGLLKKHGFEKVYQLHGGIIRYGQLTGGKNWEGKCYVFDNRIAVPVNTEEEIILTNCSHCNQPWDVYVNCTNPFCNERILICPNCREVTKEACSQACLEHPKARWREKYPELSETST